MGPYSTSSYPQIRYFGAGGILSMLLRFMIFRTCGASLKTAPPPRNFVDTSVARGHNYVREGFMALLFRRLSQATGGLVKIFQVAAIRSEQAFEAGDEIVVRGDGIEFGVVDRVGEPAVVFGAAAPGGFF